MKLGNLLILGLKPSAIFDKFCATQRNRFVFFLKISSLFSSQYTRELGNSRSSTATRGGLPFLTLNHFSYFLLISIFPASFKSTEVFQMSNIVVNLKSDPAAAISCSADRPISSYSDSQACFPIFNCFLFNLINSRNQILPPSCRRPTTQPSTRSLAQFGRAVCLSTRKSSVWTP